MPTLTELLGLLLQALGLIRGVDQTENAIDLRTTNMFTLEQLIFRRLLVEDARLTDIIRELNHIDVVVSSLRSIIPPPPPTPTAVAGAVWNQELFPIAELASDLLQYAGGAQQHFSANDVRQTWVSPYFLVWFDRANETTRSLPSGDYPTGDWTDILPSDTRLSWLTRTEPNWSWTLDPVTSLVQGSNTVVAYPTIATFTMTEAQWRAATGLSSLASSAPIWPGLANVTLGAPVALADGLVVAGPMAGVLVELTTAPPGAGVWVLGSTHNYYNWGEVSFVQDNGDQEPFQFLGGQLGLYMPKQMAIAQSAIFRVNRLPTGQVTPFTIP